MKKVTIFWGGESGATAEDCGAFITEFEGKFRIGDIGGIEDAIPLEIRDGTAFDQGAGEYEFSVRYDSGQQGEYGMWEICPYWEFERLSFKSCESLSEDDSHHA